MCLYQPDFMQALAKQLVLLSQAYAEAEERGFGDWEKSVLLSLPATGVSVSQ